MRKTKTNIRIIFSSLVIVVMALFINLVLPAVTSAQVGTPTDLVTCSGYACKWCDVFALLQTVFNTATVIIFPLVVIYIIYGAVLYVTSATSGSQDGLTKARGTITDAIIGLILILLSFVIVNAVIVGITGSKIENFVNIDCSVIDTNPGGGDLQDVPAPSNPGTPPGPQAHGTKAEQEVRNVFKAAQPEIKINHENPCPDTVNSYKDCTNVAGMTDNTINGILETNKECEAYKGKSCDLMITAGTEKDGHSTKEGGHLSGSKADFRHNAALDDFIMHGCGDPAGCYIGKRIPGDGSDQYKGPNGSIWADEKGDQPHWDVKFP